MTGQRAMHPDGSFIAGFKGKAISSLSEAHACLKSGHLSAAVSRGYFALYQAANAWMAFRHYRRDDREEQRRNWRHETVAKHWRLILADLQAVLGAGQIDFDGPEIYKAVHDVRIQSDYKAARSATHSEAIFQLCDSERACSWILAALAKEGL